MDGLSVSFVTLITTVAISYFIACVIKIMVTVLEKFAKPEVVVAANEPVVIKSTDESEIAAVIAIANSRK